MRLNRLIILTLLAGLGLFCGCKNVRWDWWRASGPDPVVKGDDLGEGYDEESDEDLPGDAASRPTTSSGPSSGPPDREGWTRAPKVVTSRTARPGRKGGKSIQTPILFVNDEVLSVEEVLEPFWPQLEQAAKEMTLPEYRRFLRETLKRRVILLIDELLAYGEAKKEITDEMEPAIIKAVDETEQRRINAEFGGLFSRYQAYLESHGQKRADVRRRIRRTLVVKQYLKDEFLPLIRPPTRRDLLKYYRKHPEEFTVQERVEMFLIDVPYWRFLKGTAAKDARATWAKLRGPRRLEARRAAAQHMAQARQELASGIPFEAVARSYSFGPNAGKGGAWGVVSRGGLTGRWAAAAEVLFDLKAGQVSDVVRTDEGLGLVKAGERFEQRVVPFLEAQPAIERKLVRRHERRLEDELIFKLHKKATITDLSSFFQALYEGVPKHPRQRQDYKLVPGVR